MIRLQDKTAVVVLLIVVTSLCILSPANAASQSAATMAVKRQPISLAQALKLALAHNRVLRAAMLQSAAAQSDVGVARGAMLPRLDASENYSNTNNPTLVFSNLLNQQDFGPNNFNIDRLNSPASFSNFQSVIQLTQPIFTGGRLWASLKASHDAADAARWRAIRVRQEIEFEVVSSYYRAVLLQERVGVLERALAAARAHREQAENMFKHGMVVKADVLRARVMEGTFEQERNVARNQLLTAWESLAHTLGTENRAIAPRANPPELARAGKMGPRSSLEALIAKAIAKRPELKMAQAEIDRAEQNLKIARAGYLPSVSVSAAYQNDSEDFSRAGNSYSVFVTGKINLFNGLATSSKVAAAADQLQRAREMADQLKHGIALQVQRAYHALTAASENLEVARRNRAYASDAARILEDRYGSGLATNVDVLDAETSRKRAAMQLADAKVAVMVSHAALELASGQLNLGTQQ